MLCHNSGCRFELVVRLPRNLSSLPFEAFSIQSREQYTDDPVFFP